MYKKYIKRLLDVILSFLALVVLGLPMLIVGIFIKSKIGSPIIFKQKRIGQDNKEFLLWKFRSMMEARDKNGIYLPDAKRITPLGKFIRETSIDELPSLFNILKGEMSIIGPRPLPVRYLSRYSKEQLRRHEVKPGLSNVSIVNGRNMQTWEDQFEKEVWYVDHVSFIIDAKSVIDTIKIVFTGEGATSEDGDVRCEFIGTADPATLFDNDHNYMKIE